MATKNNNPIKKNYGFENRMSPLHTSDLEMCINSQNTPTNNNFASNSNIQSNNNISPNNISYNNVF